MLPENAVGLDAPIAALLEHRRAFLRFLERRVGDAGLAEDILQDAFTKVVARPESVPGGGGTVPWFYRTLRNASIDRLRRRDVAERGIAAFARELEHQPSPAPELDATICACVTELTGTLKPEYAEALREIDVLGTPVKVFAARKGLSPGNAGVRVFRAREALKKRVIASCGVCAAHGCVDCTCRSHGTRSGLDARGRAGRSVARRDSRATVVGRSSLAKGGTLA